MAGGCPASDFDPPINLRKRRRGGGQFVKDRAKSANLPPKKAREKLPRIKIGNLILIIIIFLLLLIIIIVIFRLKAVPTPPFPHLDSFFPACSS